MSTVVEAVLAGLAERADPERAEWQRAYMKSALPFHGVSLPETRALVRSVLRAHPIGSREEWEATVRELWDDAAFREEWYAALAVVRSGRRWFDPTVLGLARHLVVTGAWWDVVDETAQHLVGACLLADRARVTTAMRAWAVDDDLRLRRTAVICQISHGEALDRDLLTHAIEHNLDDPSFWLRKAVGWALRRHARVDPDWVRAYVDSLGDRLSGLSRREATKHL